MVEDIPLAAPTQLAEGPAIHTLGVEGYAGVGRKSEGGKTSYR